MAAEMAVVVAASLIFLVLSIVHKKMMFTYATLAILTSIVAFVYAARAGLPSLAYLELGIILWSLFQLVMAGIGWIGEQEAPPE